MSEPLLLVNIPQKTIDLVKEMNGNGVPMAQIARELRIKQHHVKRIVDPESYETYKTNKKLRDREYYKKSVVKTHSEARVFSAERERRDPLYDPNRDGKVFHQTLSDALTGVPLPGRSALDQRNKSKQLESVN
jgi:hypothetical protein